MNRRVVAVTAVAFTAAAVVAGLTIPASAGVPAPTATAPAVAPDAFTAMQRDFRLDAAGVAVRLA